MKKKYGRRGEAMSDSDDGTNNLNNDEEKLLRNLRKSRDSPSEGSPKQKLKGYHRTGKAN